MISGQAGTRTFKRSGKTEGGSDLPAVYQYDSAGKYGEDQ